MTTARLWRLAAALAFAAGCVMAAETNLFNITTNVPAGTNLVAVTWTNVLPAPPTLILAGVRAPNSSGAGSYKIFCNPINSSVATNGVNVELSGITDTTGYVVTVSVWE